MVVPWSAFWERNFFFQTPMVADWLSNSFLRGAVSGVGLITALAGLAELAGAFRRRAPETDTSADRPEAG
jgi:hypothetical protein